MFSFHVQHAGPTRILVRPLDNGRQLTCYETTIFADANEWNALILPVPRGPTGVLLWNANHRTWLDAERPFQQLPNFEPNRVEQIGCFDVSTVPTLADVEPEYVSPFMRKHYAAGDFSFVVCRFQGTVKGHVVAYEHDRLPSGNLFVPMMRDRGMQRRDPAPEGEPFGPGVSRFRDELVFDPPGKVAEVVHSSVYCDQCLRGPIVGVRYKCANCLDHDECSACHADSQHDPRHVFLILPKEVEDRARVPTEAPILGHLLYDLPRQPPVCTTLYDHTVYLDGAVLCHVPNDYTEFRTAKPCMTRVKVHGRFPNKDYMAAATFS